MLEAASLNSCVECFELEFLVREATTESEMRLGIRLDLAGLSLSDTIRSLGTIDGPMSINRR